MVNKLQLGWKNKSRMFHKFCTGSEGYIQCDVSWVSPNIPDVLLKLYFQQNLSCYWYRNVTACLFGGTIKSKYLLHILISQVNLPHSHLGQLLLHLFIKSLLFFIWCVVTYFIFSTI